MILQPLTIPAFARRNSTSRLNVDLRQPIGSQRFRCDAMLYVTVAMIGLAC